MLNHITFFIKNRKVRVFILLIVTLIIGLLEMLSVALVFPVLNFSLASEGIIGETPAGMAKLLSFYGLLAEYFDTKEIIVASILLIFIAILTYLMTLFFTWVQLVFSTTLVLETKERIFYKLMSLDFDFFVSTKNSSILHVLFKSTESLSKIIKPGAISGIWTATQELDFRKYSMSLTQEGKDWLERYLPYYDQPDVRCTSIGLPALVTYSFPFEIIYSNGRYTFLYEYQSKVRRIWTNTESPSSFMPPSRMGFSRGIWEDNELVVKTQLLEKTVRDFRGELISENATIEERYSLSDDGQTLTALIIVDDPDSYQRQPIRRRQWVRNINTEIFPYSCDPDSFYVPMYEDGEMQMYIDRSPLRF